MDGLIAIIFILIGWAIKKVKKSVEEAESTTKKQQGNATNQTVTQQRQQYATRQNNQYAQRQSQQELKQRLQQKYGTQSVAKEDDFKVGVANKGSILSRALDNVEENDEDVVLQENHAEVCVDYRTNPVPHGMGEHVSHSADCESFEDSDIMQRVNDLMIMGYSGDMEFERDFVAEGVDMLNSFSA